MAESKQPPPSLTLPRKRGGDETPSPSTGTGWGGGDHHLSVRDLLPRSPIGRLAENLLRFIRKGFARVVEFAPTKLNLSWVTDDLAVGGAFRSPDIPRLRRLGIRSVVDCREEASDDEIQLTANGISYLRLPTPDAHELRQEDLAGGVRWIEERLAAGDKVYVHCLHGVGRAPLLAACLLVSKGASAEGALRLVKARRWQASPNEEQLEALLTYAKNASPSSPKD